VSEAVQESAEVGRTALSDKLKPPVFVVGSARSGTNFLYDTLLSSGGFAIYRTEPVVFDILLPKFGDLSQRRNREKLLAVWFKSYQFRLSRLDRGVIEEKILRECHNAGQFLTIVMNELARLQGVERWAAWGPDNLLYIPLIARTVPDALFLHIIRDGRDVALSMTKKKFVRPFPWDGQRSLLVAALHWKWKVEVGRAAGRKFPSRYMEICFEDFVGGRTCEVLEQIGRFIGHDLDYDRIRRSAIGTVGRPNTTFEGADGRPTSEPIGRWKSFLSKAEVEQVESVLGTLLEDLGYPREFPAAQTKGLAAKFMKVSYPAFFDLKEWLKIKTPLGRLVNINRLQFNAIPK